MTLRHDNAVILGIIGVGLFIAALAIAAAVSNGQPDEFEESDEPQVLRQKGML